MNPYTAHREGLITREERNTKLMTWEERCKAAPLGTKAPAIGGGYWTKTENGWKWRNGATFPCPGGDWNGELIEPDNGEKKDNKE